MHKLLDTLYIPQKQTHLTAEGDNIIILSPDDRTQVSVEGIQTIVCFDFPGMSPSLLHLCADKSISIYVVRPYNEFLTKVSGPLKGTGVLRHVQYKACENEQKKFHLARYILIGRIMNCRTVLQKAIRDHREDISLQTVQAVNKLLDCYKNIDYQKNINGLISIEKQVSDIYYDCFSELIISQKSDFLFKKTPVQPPLDRFNSLLTFLYTLLAHDISLAVEAVGLDPAYGFFHEERGGWNCLILDFMDELGPYMADRAAISLINLKQVNTDSFYSSESGIVLLTDKAKQDIINIWQKRKQEQITHPFLNEKILMCQLPHIQALLLSRYLREDLDGYPPFLFK